MQDCERYEAFRKAVFHHFDIKDKVSAFTSLLNANGDYTYIPQKYAGCCYC